MLVKNIIDEDFVNYKNASMFIAFPKCSFKCGLQVCQNSALANSPNIEIEPATIVKRYLANPITNSFVFGGLEPFDSFVDMLELIHEIRSISNDNIVIYTGYEKSEISYYISFLKRYNNIIIKFGRYLPGYQSHYDPILGISLASDNQYAEVV